MAEVSDILRERCMLHRRGDKTALPAAHTNAMLSIETYLNRVGHITPMQSNYVQDVLGIAKKSSGGKDGGSKAITAGGASKGPIAYKKGGHYELHFTYDLQRITAVKAIQGRKWDADKKFWTVPGGVLNEETLRSIGFEIEDRTPVVRTTEVKQITKIEGLKGTPFPYQMEGISFIDSRNGRALLADEAGLGKSCQSISYVWMRREKTVPALIVCPSSLKVNWQREVYKWTGFTKTQILTGLKPTRIHPDVEVAIINYDILDRKDGSGWIEDLKSFGFKTVIADECHAVSNRKAISAKAMRSLSLKVDHFIARLSRFKMATTC